MNIPLGPFLILLAAYTWIVASVAAMRGFKKGYKLGVSDAEDKAILRRALESRGVYDDK